MTRGELDSSVDGVVLSIIVIEFEVISMNEKENVNLENDLQEAEPAELDELQQLQAENAKWMEEAKKNHDLYLRALADHENYKKRAAREREEYIKFASLPLIKQLLSVLDDMDRAIHMGGADQEAVLKGLEMIHNKLKEIVQNEGVQELETIGKPFDPQYHQPLLVEENTEYPENTVIEEMQKGYEMYGRVIRPSLVKVSS